MVKSTWGNKIGWTHPVAYRSMLPNTCPEAQLDYAGITQPIN